MKTASISPRVEDPGYRAITFEQLVPDGRLVLPIGTRFDQVITLVRPTDEGFTCEPIEPAVFVPLVGEHGFSSPLTMIPGPTISNRAKNRSQP